MPATPTAYVTSLFLRRPFADTFQPKAGQGMNTAFLDAQNLAWKIHLVEGGFAHRDLLRTYEPERRATADRLLEFDNRYAKLFSARLPAAEEVEAALSGGTGTTTPPLPAQHQQDSEFIRTFKESCKFTSGYGVSYGANEINWSPDHPAKSPLFNPEGAKVRPGHLFANSDVTRVADANVIHLEQEVPWNGSFRLFLFAGRPASTLTAIRDFSKGLNGKRSFYTTYLREDIDGVKHDEKHNPHSRFLTVCTIFAARRPQIEISRDVPGVLGRYRQHVYADDKTSRHGVPCGMSAPAHAKMGFDVNKGGVVVVRPDGYVGAVVALVEGNGTVDALNEYFSAICTKRLGGGTSHL